MNSNKLIKRFFGIWVASFFMLLSAQVLANEGYEAFRPDREGEEVSGEGFEALQAVNSDVFGWITVYGTNIDYPLVQDAGGDNRRYERINARGEPSMAGAIFMDVRNEQDFSNFNTIIYGHEMGRNAMFGELTQFATAEVFDRHPYGMIYTATEDVFHGIEFFAFMIVNAFDHTFYAPHLASDEEKEAFIARIFEEAIQYRTIDVTSQDQLVILSTCTPTGNDMRQVLIGRLTDETFDEAYLQFITGGGTWSVNAVASEVLREIGEWGLVTVAILVLVLTVCMTILVARFQIRKEIGLASSIPPKRKTKGVTLLQEFLIMSIKVSIVLSAFTLVFVFLFGVTQVADATMAPSVREGDLVFFSRRGDTFEVGEMVLVQYDQEPQVRRVIAVGGDEVDITYEGLFINGRLQQELQIFQETTAFHEGIRFPITLEENELFLLSDNRQSAQDSRIYGAIETENVLGTVITVLRRRNL